jgi:esterase/lipase superfamily enzyme
MGRVYYATNRNPDNAAAPTSFGTDFNGPGSGNLTFGIADVTAPTGHDARGLPFEADAPDAIQLSDPSPGDFSATAKQAILNGPPHLILSVHGFQYHFWDSVTRADYLSRWFNEGSFANPNSVVMFGWPSAGELSEYSRDWQYATQSGPALTQMLAAFRPLIDDFRAHKGQAAHVTLLAHSMGNHVLDIALAGPAPAPPPTYNRVIFAAADEGRNELAPQGNLAAARTLSDKVYVYYNNQDVALTASELVFHDFVVRLGVDGPPNKDDFKNTNVTFVNASAAGAGSAESSYDAEGHQYYRMIQEVRNDICAVMQGMADSQIPNRIYRDDPHYGWENYWRIDTVTTFSPPDTKHK